MTNPTTHDHSYVDSHSFTCPQCGQPFSAEIWLIVDAGARPDLLERIRAGDLHAVACPACGPLGAVDAPLLLGSRKIGWMAGESGDWRSLCQS